MTNPEIAMVFEEIADLLELLGENPFRARAYRNAARTIRELPQPLEEMARDLRCRLEDLPGIGKDLAEKIRTLIATSDLPMRQELRQKIPPGVRELLMVPGLGPKRAYALYQQLGIESLEQLKTAAEKHQIQKLRGFGPKTEQAILEALAHLEEVSRRVYLAEAKVWAESIVQHLRAVKELHQIEVAGSYRRRKETVGDLDVLVTCDDAAAVMDRLARYPSLSEVLARGDTKMSVRLSNAMQMDLRVVPAQSYGAALQYFTGSQAHNILLRRRAQELGLKINEYGVFRGEERVAGEAEEEVYRAVGLAWIPPELREARREIEWAAEGQLPKLVEISDIRGDLHMHTNATDGRATIEEMIHACKKLGYHYIAITDHSKRVTMAKGMDADRLRAHWKNIEQVAGRFPGIRVLKGVEMDILEDGSMDLPEEVLAEADWVVASIHYGQNQSRDQITRRILNAIKNPYVHCIGHPTGRLIGRRRPYELDLDEIFSAAADYGCLLEVNAQPSRLDLDDAALFAARDKGIRFVIATDAHSIEELAFMEFGVYQARRGALEAQHVVNTYPLEDLERLLQDRRRSHRP
jgi:DNA polymerase (family 10)